MSNVKRRGMFPQTIFVRLDSESGEHIPVDQMGFVYKEGEIKELFESFLRFYGTVDDEAISEYNEELLKEYNGEIMKSTKEPKEKKPTAGHVYLMQDCDNKTVKIGASKDPEARLSQLQAGNPKLDLIYKKFVSDMFKTEEELHERYKSKHIGREWFKLSQSDISKVKSHLSSISRKVV